MSRTTQLTGATSLVGRRASLVEVGDGGEVDVAEAAEHHRMTASATVISAAAMVMTKRVEHRPGSSGEPGGCPP